MTKQKIRLLFISQRVNIIMLVSQHNRRFAHRPIQCSLAINDVCESLPIRTETIVKAVAQFIFDLRKTQEDG
ncbi:MAG: hypothetical protein K2Q12_02545 [Rickettsiales bacterium]|nr:hypothetical protein [Rickettsiales bacterium]